MSHSKIGFFAKVKESSAIASIVVKAALKQTFGEGLPLPKSLDEVFIRYLIYPAMTNVIRPTLTSASHNSINMVAEKECEDIINTVSYNYVGLARLDTTCIELMKTIIRETPGCGFSVSPMVDSSLTDVLKFNLNGLLEREVEKFTGKEACVLTASGYMANSAALREIATKETIVILDSLSHNSMWSGFKASGAKLIKFKHNSMEDLDKVLTRVHQEAAAVSKSPNDSDKTVASATLDSTKKLAEETLELSPHLDVIVAIEGLYSMEGTIPNMLEIQRLKEKYNFKLFVDEAHSFYSIGKTGRGVVEHFNLSPDLIDFHAGTFSKGWASIGGFLAANKETIAKIRRQSLYFAQAQINLPLIVTCRVLYCFWEESSRVERQLKRLHAMAIYVRSNLRQLGFKVLGEDISAVIPVIVFRWTVAKQFLLKCRSLGVGVILAGYPATPFFESRIRLCLTADLTNQDVNTLVSAFYTVGVEMGLIKRKSSKKQKKKEPLETILEPFSSEINPALNSSPTPPSARMQSLIDQVVQTFKTSYPKNDYFGLSQGKEETIQATLDAFDVHSLGSCGPALFYGTYKTHVKLEEQIASLFGTESASVFSSSFNGTVSIVAATSQKMLFGYRHVILADDMCNRQIMLGLEKKSREVEVILFKHNDVTDFTAKLAGVFTNTGGSKKKNKNKVFISVCLEAVFRRTGTIPPLNRYNEILTLQQGNNGPTHGGTDDDKNKTKKMKKKGKMVFRFLINEEQSLGMLKPSTTTTTTGSTTSNIKHWSLLSHHGIEIADVKTSNHIFYGSLSHSLCSQGGWMTGSHKDIVTLCCTNAAYFFSANSPPVSAVVALENLKHLVDNHESLQRQLKERGDLLKKHFDTGLSSCLPICILQLKKHHPQQQQHSEQEDLLVLDSIIDKWGTRIQMEKGSQTVSASEEERGQLRVFLSNCISQDTLQEFVDDVKQWFKENGDM